MEGILPVKLSVLLLIVIGMTSFQIAVVLLHPVSSRDIQIAANSHTTEEREKSSRSSTSSSSGSASLQGSTLTIALQTVSTSSESQTVTVQPPPPSTQAVTTFFSKPSPQVTPPQDYTPIAVAIVAAAAIVGVVIMFVNRRR